MVTQTKFTGKVGIGGHAPVAGATTNGSNNRLPSRNAPPSPPAKKKGGRKREDGLAPGSPEADRADKEKDRLRKQQERALVDPAPLPSADTPAGDQANPSPGNPPVGPGDGASLPPVPWEAKEFRPWIDKAFDGSEKARMAKREFVAREAGFSDPAVKKFVNDARYPGGSRETLADSAAKGLAYGANKMKLSRGAGEGMMALIAATMFFFDNRRSDQEFARAVAMIKKNGGRQSEEK